MKLPGRCIFCGGFRLTKEHLFPNWLKALFPRDGSSTHTHGTVMWPGGQQVVRTKKGQGHSGTKKLRVVCMDCNRGWMSDLEENAKPHLTRLIRGNFHSITPDVQQALSLWAAKTASVGENINPGQQAVRKAERDTIMASQVVPDHWLVFISPYSGTEYSELFMHQHTNRYRVPNNSGPGPIQHYAQVSTIGLGQVIFTVLATSWTVISRHYLGFDMPQHGYCQISPTRTDSISWPTSLALDDRQARELITTIRNMMFVAQVPVKW